jgi:hypothetical protein
MARKKSLTSQLYRLARDSNNLRAASRGPTAYAKRYARRKVYGKTMGLTDRLVRVLGLTGRK